MRLLLDTCIPERLRHHLIIHEVQTARFAGLDGLPDAALLDAMQGTFDALVTCDQGIPWQQNMKGRSIAVAVLIAPSNRLPDLAPLVPALLAALDVIRPGEVREISA
jgi:hypothetical protein